jgi:hypothetical protein
MYPVRTFPPYLSEMLSNIVFPSKPTSSAWSLPFRFSTQNTVCISHLSRTWHIPRLSKPPWFRHPNNIWCSWSLCSLLQSPATSCLLVRIDVLSTLFSNTLSLCSSLSDGVYEIVIYRTRLKGAGIAQRYSAGLRAGVPVGARNFPAWGSHSLLYHEYQGLFPWD